MEVVADKADDEEGKESEKARAQSMTGSLGDEAFLCKGCASI